VFAFNFQDHLPAVWWTVTVLLMLVGVAGTLLPLLPGTTLILAGAVVHKIAFPEGLHTITWWTVGAQVVLMLLSHGVDFVSGAVGANTLERRAMARSAE